MVLLHSLILLLPVVLSLLWTSCAEDPVVVTRQDREFISSEKGRVNTDEGTCTEPRTFFTDADRDGFGDPEKPVKACVAPAGHVEDGTDCADDDPRAFPGQKQFFSSPRPDGTFDFDCDGQSSVRLTLRAACEENPETRHCAATSGWDLRPSDKLPDCGQAADWAWNECRTELIPDAPPAAEAVPPGPEAAPVISIPSLQKTVSRCWSGKLAWKKRQLCR